MKCFAIKLIISFLILRSAQSKNVGRFNFNLLYGVYIKLFFTILLPSLIDSYYDLSVQFPLGDNNYFYFSLLYEEKVWI